MRGKEYYYSKFPESLFAAENPKAFSKSVVKGYDACSGLKVVICGLCRDVETILPATISRIEKIRSFFSNSQVIILENDSTDNTPSIIKAYERKSSGVKSITPIVKDKKKYSNEFAETGMSFGRMALMSNLRNIYLDELHDYKNFDYVIMIDMDLLGGWSYEGFLSCFAYKKWSAMGSNGLLFKEDTAIKNGSIWHKKTKRLFFDTWAFRELGQDKFKGYVLHESLYLEKGEEPVEVNSVFSGLGIYRIQDVLQCEYRPFSSFENPVCEHVSFHEQIRSNGGKVYINPSMITLYSPTEYTPS